MKKMAIMLTAAALACTVGATGAWAAGPGRTMARRACNTAACLFADENGDGVCDYRGTGSCRNDADGDGVCDYRGTGTCRNDADGDGVCDYRGTGTCRNDADGDGVCDYQGAGTCRNDGYGCRGGWGACRG